MKHRKTRLKNLILERLPLGNFLIVDTKSKSKNLVAMRNNDFRCTCWWYANRASVNNEKYGYCCHVLKVLEVVQQHL